MADTLTRLLAKADEQRRQDASDARTWAHAGITLKPDPGVTVPREELRAVLERVEAAEARVRALATGWVPVAERLPERGCLVAVLLHGNVTAAFLTRDGGWSLHWRDRAMAEEVAAWHALPSPPGEQGG